MPRYTSQDSPADQPLADGDSGFVGWVSNRQSPVVPPGHLEHSRNLRLDNLEVRVRDGIEPVSTDLTLTNPPVMLDVTLPSALAIVSITRSGSTATVTTLTAHGWSTGEVVAIEGAAQSEYNIDATITVTGSTTFTYTVSGTPATPATLATTVVDGTTGNGGFETAGTGGQPFADWTAVTDSSPITRDTTVYRSGTASCKFNTRPISSDNTIYIQRTDLVVGKSYLISLYGQTASSDSFVRARNESGSIGILGIVSTSWTAVSLRFTATSSTLRLVTYNAYGGAFTPTYLDDIVIQECITASAGPQIYNTYDDVVRCSCQFATNDTDRTEWVILASTDTAWAVRPGASSVAIGYPANEEVAATDEASMLYWNGRVFLFRGYKTAAAVAITSITRSSTTATCTTTAVHGLTTGDWVFIQDATPLGYCGIVQVTVSTTTVFTYTVNSGLTTPATLDGATVRKCKRPLVWDGNFANDFVAVTTGALSTTSGTLIRLPPVPWAIDAGSRLAIPFKPDQIVISDPYDEESLDLQYQEFRLRYGSFDAIVAAFPTQQNVLFVLCRRSLHRLVLGDFAIADAKELTRDAGCAARRTLCQWGEQILFLGDRAIHRVRLTGELSLLPERVPLSADIQDVFESVDWTAISRACSVVWNNRAYFALPDPDSSLNTIVLIFNFINDRWETQDSYPAGFDVEGWHIMDYAGEKRLFASTTNGFLYLLEENAVDTFGPVSSQQDYDIEGSGRTRHYTGGTREVKRCRRLAAHLEVPADAEITAQVATQNPDATGDLVTIDEAAAEEGRYPIYAGLNGTGAQLRFTLTARAALRAVEADFAGPRSRGYDRST